MSLIQIETFNLSVFLQSCVKLVYVFWVFDWTSPVEYRLLIAVSLETIID